MGGEIDIFEGVNGASTANQMTLHTSSGCTAGATKMLGVLAATSDCQSPGAANLGCGIRDPSQTSYGPGNVGGSVFATEWTKNGQVL